MHKSRLKLFTGLLLYGCALIHAEEDLTRGLLDKSAVIQSAAGITRDKYPEADTVLVDAHVLNRYNVDGICIRRQDTYLKVLTERGKTDNQTQALYFTIPYSTEKDVGFAVLEVIKPDGQTMAIDVASQGRIMIDPSGMDQNIYNPNDKILQVGVPGLEVGAILHSITFERVVKPLIKDTWCNYCKPFQSATPLKHCVYEVLAPKERPLKSIALKDAIRGTVTFAASETNGFLMYRWEARDVPKMFEEPNMPSAELVVQRLLVSTVPDWPHISRWYWNISQPHYDVSPEIQRQVAELTKGLAERRQIIAALFRFVSQEVRYLGLATEASAPGYEPQDVKETFSRRRGVCRDKAALLVALLRQAGLEAFPVLIYVGPKIDPDVPELYFNHVIVGVRDAPCGYILMDPTNEDTRQLLPAYLNDRSYLVATPAGEPLRTSAIDPAENNLMHIDTKGTIDSQGNLIAETVLVFEGVNDNVYRADFARRKPEERRRFFESAIKSAAAGAHLDAITIEPRDMLDTSRTLTVRLKFSAKDMLIEDHEVIIVPLPTLGTRIGKVNSVLGQTGLEQRKYPLVTTFACGVKETIALTFNELPGNTVILPGTTHVENASLAWNSACDRQDNLIRVATDFRLKVAEFTPSQYLVLKDTLKKREFDLRKNLLFTHPRPTPASQNGPEADVAILAEHIDYDLEDAHNWTETASIRKQVRTYAGKKEYSEIKINYNPVWEKVKLERAVVSNAANTITINEQEVNVMDADWVGAAPRYPAAKTLVASLPGVEIGSVVDYRIVRHFSNHPFFAATESFQAREPIKTKTVTIRAPVALRLKILGPSAPAKVTAKTDRQDSKIVYSWEAHDCQPVTREEHIPPLWSFTPTVFVSAGDWRDYAADVQNTLLQAGADQAGLKKQVDEIVGQAADPVKKAIAIRDFVAKNIRAAGPKFNELPLASVFPASRTLQEGYGNVTDRAVLLYALLHAAGFHPEFVLSSQSAPLLEGLQKPLRESPDPAWFDGVLVRLKLGPDYVYLNDTDQYAALGSTRHDGSPGMALGKGKIETIGAQKELGNNRSEIYYRIELSADGSAFISKTIKYFGCDFMRNRKFFAEMPPEERRRYHQEAVAEISRAARAEGDLITRFDTYPGIEELKVNADKFAVREGDFLYLSLPESLSNFLPVLSDTRAAPLWLKHPEQATIETEIIMPPDFDAVLRPPSLAWQAPCGGGTVAVTNLPIAANSRSLRIIHNIKLTPAVFPADQYGELLEMNRQVSQAKAQLVLFKRAKPIIYAEIPGTAEDFYKGLMGRKYLPRNGGMLFDFRQEQQLSFWMANTYLPLQIAYIKSNGTIGQIEKMAPLGTNSMISNSDYRYALEVNDGWFDDNHIYAGAQAQLPETAPWHGKPPEQDHAAFAPEMLIMQSYKDILKHINNHRMKVVIEYTATHGLALPAKTIEPPFEFQATATGDPAGLLTAWDCQTERRGDFLIENITAIKDLDGNRINNIRDLENKQ